MAPDTLRTETTEQHAEATRPDHHHWPRWLPPPKYLLAAMVLALVVVMALRASSAQHDFVEAFTGFRSGRLWWLALAVVAEAAAVASYGLAQRRLLRAGGRGVDRRSMVGLAFGSTGVSALVPVGVVPASGWLITQYRRREVPISLAAWAVLAGGFVATVTILALALVGAGVAGVGRPPLLAVSGAVLVIGSTGFVIVVHRLDRVEKFVARHHWRRGVGLLHQVVVKTSGVLRYRAGVRGGSEVFGYAAVNWLADALCLVAAFGLVGKPIPWGGVLFAFAAAQVAGSVSPLPAGIGVVEGGLVGALSLTGVPVGTALVATVVYRVISYWAMAGIGSAMAVVMSRRSVRMPAERLAGHRGWRAAKAGGGVVSSEPGGGEGLAAA
ncbi:MAG: lysylphosphatidylglycerol synthase transmembrane domain-containing protein [Acidimicrobiales bacterium]